MSTPCPSTFTKAEQDEIDHCVGRFRAFRGHGSISIQINFNDGNVPVVVVNGRRFERPEEIGDPRKRRVA